MRTISRFLLLLSLAAMFYVVPGASARTWRVALDGSGDTDSINEACQVAASGDSVYIAPGRYSTLETFIHYGTTRQVMAVVQGDKDLTIYGDHQDSVVIGPLQYQLVIPDSPIGILWWSTGTLALENISIVNSYAGFRVDYGGVRIVGCGFVGNGFGISASYQTSNVGLSSSRIASGGGGSSEPRYSVFATDLDSLTIAECEFIDSGKIDLEGVEWVEVRDSILNGVRLDMVRGHGEIERCTFNRRLGVGSAPSGSVIVRDNKLLINSIGVSYTFEAVGNGGLVELYGNVIEQAEAGTMRLQEGASVLARGNHILHGFGVDSVYLLDYPEGNTATIDLRHNWWGTPDSTIIDDWIWDGNDDPSVHAVVEYLPIATGPVPAEKTSLGGLKALFR